MKRIIIIAALALVGCGGSVVQERPTTVSIPVPQPCVDGPRPASVKPIREQMTRDERDTLDVRQKAALVGKQGLDLRAYGEDMNAATGGCH